MQQYKHNVTFLAFLFRDIIYANRLRKEKLKAALDVLNKFLVTRHTLVGDSFTLADVCVAAQLMPLFYNNWNKPLSAVQVENI